MSNNNLSRTQTHKFVWDIAGTVFCAVIMSQVYIALVTEKISSFLCI